MRSSGRAVATVVVAVALAAVSGCATLVKGTTQQVSVTTDPAGAMCRFDRKGSMVGIVNPTPGTVSVSKGWGDLDVACSKDGYEEATALMTASFQAMTLGNVLLGGIIGIVIDASSGAMVEYPTSIEFVLFPLEFTSAADRDALFARQRDAVMAETERLKEQVRARCTTGDCTYQYKPIDDARDAKLNALEERRKRAKVTAAVQKAT